MFNLRLQLHFPWVDKLNFSVFQDFGQKLVGVIQCDDCGMNYTPGEPTDEATHSKFHQRILSALKFPVSDLKLLTSLLVHVDLVQDSGDSSASAMELPQSSTKPLMSSEIFFDKH